MRYREIVKRLQKLGCREMRQGKGKAAIVFGSIPQQARSPLCRIGAARV